MDIEKKCLRCNGANICPSDLQSTGKIYSRPKQSKFMTVFTTGAPVSAMTCLDCGHVELLVDAQKVKSLLRSA